MKTYIRLVRLAIYTGTIVASAKSAYAQFDVDVAGASGLVQNRLLDSTFRTSLLPSSFIISTNLSVAYNYTLGHLDSTGTETNLHNATLGLLIDTRIGLSAQLSLKAGYADLNSPSGTNGIGRSIGPNLQLGQEVLHLWNKDYDPTKNQYNLLVGGIFGYNYADNTAVSPLGAFSAAHATSWTYGALVSFSDRIYRRAQHGEDISAVAPSQPGDVVLTITPTYQDKETSTKALPLGARSYTELGVLNLNTRIDYEYNANWVFTVSGSLLSDINQNVGAGKKSNYENWGEFGAQASYVISPSMRLTLGYTYDAFNAFYYSHMVALTFNYSL